MNKTPTAISLILLIFSSILISACGKSPEQIEEENKAKEKQQIEENKEQLKQLVTEHLKDPSSATFRNLTLTQGESGLALCGEVNSKNSFGGYTGYSEFVAATNPLPHSKERVIFIESGIKKYLSSHDVIAAGCDAWWNSGYSLTYCIEEPTSTNRKICRVLE